MWTDSFLQRRYGYSTIRALFWESSRQEGGKERTTNIAATTRAASPDRVLSVPAGVCGRAAHDAATPPASGNGASLDAQLTCLDNATGPGAHRANTAAAAFAVTLSVPHLNRSSRMSTSSLLLAWLAWLAFICTSLADADVVAGTTSKCVSESLNGHDYLMQQYRCGICWKMMDGSPGGWWMVDGSSDDWCEVGTDRPDWVCADCAACCASWEGTSRETRSWCDCALLPSPPPYYSYYGAVGLPTPLFALSLPCSILPCVFCRGVLPCFVPAPAREDVAATDDRPARGPVRSAATASGRRRRGALSRAVGGRAVRGGAAAV